MTNPLWTFFLPPFKIMSSPESTAKLLIVNKYYFIAPEIRQSRVNTASRQDWFLTSSCFLFNKVAGCWSLKSSPPGRLPLPKPYWPSGKSSFLNKLLKLHMKRYENKCTPKKFWYVARNNSTRLNKYFGWVFKSICVRLAEEEEPAWKLSNLIAENSINSTNDIQCF